MALSSLESAGECSSEEPSREEAFKWESPSVYVFFQFTVAAESSNQPQSSALHQSPTLPHSCSKHSNTITSFWALKDETRLVSTAQYQLQPYAVIPFKMSKEKTEKFPPVHCTERSLKGNSCWYDWSYMNTIIHKLSLTPVSQWHLPTHKSEHITSKYYWFMHRKKELYNKLYSFKSIYLEYYCYY